MNKTAIALCIGAACAILQPHRAAAQEPPPEIPASLDTVPVPPVAGLDQFIQNKTAAIALGKALFWDTAAGSDGQACASCHFQAGADNRIKNQVDPGILRTDDLVSAQKFGPTATGSATSGPNYTLRVGDFPFHQFNNPNDRGSGVKFTTDDVVSSQGTFAGAFVSVQPPQFTDVCQRGPDPTFNVGGNGARKVEPRNTPTMINAVFNFRNFWDGRANNIFNGMNPFGLRDQTKRIFKKQANGTLVAVQVALPNSSLASQADGPPLSAFEMSCDGRTFPNLGRKLLKMQPLSTQNTAFDDSVLAPFRTNDIGLVGKYEDLVKQAFNPVWWNSTTQVSGFSLMENNFSLFWGLAIQAYESTLISDQTPFDGWVKAGKPNPSFITGFGAAEIRGLNVFMDKGKCINCHKGPEFSGAASHLQAENEEHGLVERMLMNDGGIALYDNGFYNTGVTKTAFDIGVGGVDPIIGQPLSFTEQYREFLLGKNFPDPFQIDPCTFAIPFDPSHCSTPPPANFRAAVNGAFKTPGLRNVELTGPYMHNGGMATLEQVVEFYNRGGNFQNAELDPDIEPLGLTTQEKADLVAFMKSLTDLRVRFQRAPFDHPTIKIFNGHPGNQIAITKTQPALGPNLGADDTFTLFATGKFGAGNLVPFAPAP